MSEFFILDQHDQPIPTDLLTWGKMFENHKQRTVARDEFDFDGQQVIVSTVFLGMDHSFSPFPHKPVLWETMIFGGPNSEYQNRYSSKEDAIKGHQEALEIAKLTFPLED